MDILIKNIGSLSKECNECLRTYLAMNDGDENLIGSLRVDCKAGSVDCPLVELPPHSDLIDRDELLTDLADRMCVDDMLDGIYQPAIDRINEAKAVLEACK